MGRTNIEWTGTPIAGTDLVAPGYVFNGWIGCTKVSPGCAHCYAESEDKRRGWTPGGWGKGKPRKRTSEQYWRQPLVWNEHTGWNGANWVYPFQENCAERTTYIPTFTPNVFCASLADWLDPDVPIQWLADLLDLIRRTPNLRWLMLTKRPEKCANRLAHAGVFAGPDTFHWISNWLDGNPPANVAIGTSVEDQQRADERIPALLRIPASGYFLSCEPLLGHLDVIRWLVRPKNHRVSPPRDIGIPALNWVIIGGESGPGARPCNVEWVRSLVRQSKDAGVKVFVKQLGARPFAGRCTCGRSDSVNCYVCAGYHRFRHHKGGDPAEWPEDLRVREYL